MLRTTSTSLSPGAEERLIRVPLRDIHPHPANANVMTEERLEKLTRNIAREGRYPPLVVRPHPELAGAYQLLDGHQRLEALRRLGHREAICFPWPCDDATALVLLATLNRLEGEDVPARRAELLAELSELLPAEELAALLPEDGRAIQETLDLLQLDTDSLLAQLTAAAGRQAHEAPRLISFVVLPDDEAVVEEAVQVAMSGLSGPNRRGQALARICQLFLEGDHGRDSEA